MQDFKTAGDDEDKQGEAISEFKASLLEDYRIMSEKAQEEVYSDNNMIEMIKANGYEFTAKGEFFIG